MKLYTILCVLFGLIILCEATKPLPGSAVIATRGEVWPRPLKVTKHEGNLLFAANNFKYMLSNTSYNCTLLQKALNRYQRILQDEEASRWDLSKNRLATLKNLTVTMQQPCSETEYPSLEANEAYLLTVTFNKSELYADTVWGIMRGLETFSQLVVLEYENQIASVQIQQTQIFDRPRYQHRGFLLDTARHYIPLKRIYEILDGLSYNKMNVFHWHITDDQSFPYVSQRYPELSAKGAYNKRQIYNVNDIKSVIEYARERGIRVIPEFDTPGHTRSWGLSHPELICEYEGIYGPMDPSKNTTYKFLQDIFSEVRSIFKDSYIHLGGDEVDYNCWMIHPAIVQFMEERNLYETQDFINYYGKKVINMVEKTNFSTIVWEEMFFDGVQLPNDTIVQIWRHWSGQSWKDNINTVTTNGKKSVLSACWYLNHIQKTWQNYYECDPTDFEGTAAQMDLVIGGEACMWGEMINEHNVISRIFPRISAVAQKLWSEYNTGNDLRVEARRLEEHSCRMNRRGVGAEPPNGPGYCD